MMLARSYVFTYNQLKLPNFVDLTLEQLNYIIKKEPRFPAVHHHLALVYINTGALSKALAELKTELEIYPTNAQARLELGETLLKQERKRQGCRAVADCREAERKCRLSSILSARRTKVTVRLIKPSMQCAAAST